MQPDKQTVQRQAVDRGPVLPGPCCLVLAMIHLTRQHFIRDLRVSRGFCHLDPSVCPPGFGSLPLASGSALPSAVFSSCWHRHVVLRVTTRGTPRVFLFKC